MPVPMPADLPAEQVPFPVVPRYRIRPDLKKLETGGPRFVVDQMWPDYVARKLELLGSHPAQCRVIGGSEEKLRAGVLQVARLLAMEHPDECRLDDRGVTFPRLGLALDETGELRECGEPIDVELQLRILRHLESLSGTSRLADALAMTVQEDLVLVTGPPGGDSASLLHVCFPSHWNPEDRAGASFVQLHQPVPHNEPLIAGSRNLVAAMLSKGPFIRHVWSVTSSPDLDQNPARPHPQTALQEDDLLSSLYFRAERQTTTPLDGLALFTIRIYVTPLRGMLDPKRASLLASAIRTMDEELLRYKSLTALREPLLAELDGLARA